MSLDFTSSMDDSAFTEGLRRMTRGAIAANDKINSAFKDLGKIPGIGALTAGLSVGGLTAGLKTVLDFSGALQDSSDALGINVEALQGLQGAFAQSGADAESVGKSLSKLTIAQQEAAAGSEPLIKAFRDLGISAKDIRSDSPDELLLKISDGFATASDKGEAYAAVLALLGKGGKQMAAGLASGREEIEKQMAATTKLSKEEVANLDAAGDAWTRFGTTVKVSAAKAVNAVSELYDQTKPDNVTNGPGAGNKLIPAAASLLFGYGGIDSNAADAGDMMQGREAIEKRKNDAKWAAMRKQYREENPDPSDAPTKAEEQLDTSRKTALQKQVEDGNKIYMAGANERRELQKKAQEDERNLDEANAKAQKSALQKQVEDGFAVWKHAEDKKLDYKKEAMEKQLDIERGGLQVSLQQLSNAEANMMGFNRDGPDARRQANRDFNREQRAKSREARMADNPNARDARSGAARRLADLERAEKSVQLTGATITALANALALANDKLICAP